MLTTNQQSHIQSWHRANKTIVLVTGVFDMLHRAHREFLNKARDQGDVLIVGLESDLRVKHIKGEDRPINSEAIRKSNLEAEKVADLVFILPEQFNAKTDYTSLLQKIKPTILAVSSHTKHLDVKRQLMSHIGGEVRVVMKHDPSVSTTQLINEQLHQ